MCFAETLCLAWEEMRSEHLDAVVKIEKAVFSNPWRRRDFLYALKKEGGYCLVALAGGRVIGYSVGFSTQEKFHLADFAVHPEYQGQGIGRRFLNVLLDALERRLTGVVTLEVRASNTAAIALYRRAGFQTVGIRRGYYSRPAEDALVMRKALRGGLSDALR